MTPERRPGSLFRQAPKARGVLPVFVLAVFLGIVASAGAGSSAVARSTANSKTYKNTAGRDARAPHITSITVSNTDAGLIRFNIRIPSRRQLSADMFMELWIDADQNTRTGSPNFAGVDYVIQLVQGEINLYHWDGTNFTRRLGDPSATTLDYSFRSGATISISAAELGNTRALRFLADAASGIVIDQDTGAFDDANAHVDVAPNAGGGLYEYDVKMRPPKLQVKKLAATPSAPRAGGTFSLALSLARSDSHAAIRDGVVTCSGRAGGSTLTPTAAHFVRSAAVCSWRIPAGSAGKPFSGSVAVVFEGIRVARGVSARIR
jgi:hypothetical protein